jgi:hypothetical protein
MKIKMNEHKKFDAILLVTTLFLAFALSLDVFGAETLGEKAAATTNKAVDSTKATGRNIKDEVCKMVDGAMKCLPKKIRNKAESAVEKAESKAKEIKNQVD